MIAKRFIPLWITASLLLVMFLIGSMQFEGFASVRVVTNLFRDNAFLLITALGMTLVIISGGIDLSVGSVIALSGVLTSVLITEYHWHPLLAFALVLPLGTLFGALMGSIIHVYKLQPFIVTLAGMFLARGMATTISEESIAIDHPFYDAIADLSIALPGHGSLDISSLIFILFFIIVAIMMHYSRFGINVYALGGNAQSAELMGISIAKTTISIYALSSFLATLAGIVFTFYTFSGYALGAIGVELDAIAAVVIGGTLLTGGRGFVLGTVLGVFLMGVIQTYITFDGTLSSWWTKIVIGLLLFFFIVLQKLLNGRKPSHG
ncbi:sugar ABC transporter permease YjfF [Shewanella sp. SM34]|uniref:galactofuranose ABC transporter, permease protein YjfF n=1 Tax=unclassified Shewanella TaxID=196818 RepID=UPI0021D80264|nr:MULTISPECIES: galactofuranose ABC transporter, permease protein YjfF [unclassified Shewanella]MCU8009991.1 sugar ABC transporter permease YjfF [Shewanella sp. SM87]MCU8057121.1 sugar ABC transporter permease YjfF [Shewanella sp. SM35]MCU8066059.1 sugar ABC transporter permease YjfF [Shewanella sp. SM34]